MATRSVIIQKKDENFKAIYCHYDGDDRWPILQEHYSTQEKVDELIKLWNLSRLWKDLWKDEWTGKFDKINNWKLTQKQKDKYYNQCLAYWRDRECGWDKATKYNNLEKIDSDSYGAAYAYLFDWDSRSIAKCWYWDKSFLKKSMFKKI